MLASFGYYIHVSELPWWVRYTIFGFICLIALGALVFAVKNRK